MPPLHSLSTIHHVFDAVQAAARNLRPTLPNLADAVGAPCAAIKDSLLQTAAGSGSGPESHKGDAGAIAEVELQVALRSALAYLEKAQSDAGPLLFFRRDSLGYELAEVVRGLQHAADKAHAAGLFTGIPSAAIAADPSSVITWLTSIEAQLRTEVAQLFAGHGGDVDAMLAASQHHPLTASLLRAAPHTATVER
jgi:hypothetical protein